MANDAALLTASGAVWNASGWLTSLAPYKERAVPSSARVAGECLPDDSLAALHLASAVCVLLGNVNPAATAGDAVKARPLRDLEEQARTLADAFTPHAAAEAAANKIAQMTTLCTSGEASKLLRRAAAVGEAQAALLRRSGVLPVVELLKELAGLHVYSPVGSQYVGLLLPHLSAADGDDAPPAGEASATSGEASGDPPLPADCAGGGGAVLMQLLMTSPVKRARGATGRVDSYAVTGPVAVLRVRNTSQRPLRLIGIALSVGSATLGRSPSTVAAATALDPPSQWVLLNVVVPPCPEGGGPPLWDALLALHVAVAWDGDAGSTAASDVRPSPPSPATAWARMLAEEGGGAGPGDGLAGEVTTGVKRPRDSGQATSGGTLTPGLLGPASGVNASVVFRLE